MDGKGATFLLYPVFMSSVTLPTRVDLDLPQISGIRGIVLVHFKDGAEIVDVEIRHGRCTTAVLCT
jgi:hypothetical protein